MIAPDQQGNLKLWYFPEDTRAKAEQLKYSLDTLCSILMWSEGLELSGSEVSNLLTPYLYHAQAISQELDEQAQKGGAK